MKITKKHLIGALFIFLLFLTYSGYILKTGDVSAQNLWDQQIGKDNIGRAFGESGEPRDVRLIVIYVIKIFLTFVGIILLVIMMLAGFNWMTSGGSEEKVKKAKSQIYAAVIGILIILMSHLLVIAITECVLDIALGSTSWMCNP